MTFLKSERFRRCRTLLTVALFFVALLTIFCLSVGAELSCIHDGTMLENGFCGEDNCGGYELPTLNEGEASKTDDDVWEIANAGQLYYFKNEILQKKAPETPVRAKLTANITVNKALLDESGNVNDAHLEEGAIKASVYTWWLSTTVSNVVLDGDGYVISGLYGARSDTLPAGFFGTAESVTIRNLGIVDSYFPSHTDYAGVFFGEVLNGCVLENCFALDNVTDGAMSAGLVGNLGYVDKASVVSRCYTDAPSAFFACDAKNTLSACYYLGASESDAIGGTTHIADLADATLLEALCTDEVKWEMSCLRGAPMLRAEHYYKNECDADCVNRNDVLEGGVVVKKGCGHSREVGEEGRVEHEFDNKCDEKCNICGNVRTLEKNDHYYSNVCDTECNECKFVRVAPENHKFTNQCDEYCNYCQFKRVPPVVGHEYSNDCDPICNWCNYKRDNITHDYEVKCEIQVCKVCATTTPGGIPHVFDNACDSDCNTCGMTRKTEHKFGEFVTVQEPTRDAEGLQERVCSECGKKETKPIEKLSSVSTFVWILLIAIGGGVLLVAAAITVILLLRKKKKAPKAPEEAEEKPAEDAEN